MNTSENTDSNVSATEGNVKPPASSQPKSIARSAGIVGIAVMGSRILGLVREQVFATFFGAGFAMDAFLIAFRIPNLLRDLFAEGALSAAFVSTFSQTITKRGEQAAWRLANLVNNALIVVISLIVLAGIIFAPQIVNLLLDLREELGLTLLFIGHDLAMMRYLCDRIAVMHQGRIVEEGLADAVIASPQQAYTRMLVSSCPALA